MDLSKLSSIKKAKTRSISPENPTGAPGKGGMCPLEEGSAKRAARDLGLGWKVNPYTVLQPGEVCTIADIEGPGVINHIWLTPTGRWRNTIIRFYWDESENPSVECPVGDFFCMGWNEYAQMSALPVCVNPGSAFNCYWQMPFRHRARITISNDSQQDANVIAYRILYRLHPVPDDTA
jgi:hypothetical protein